MKLLLSAVVFFLFSTSKKNWTKISSCKTTSFIRLIQENVNSIIIIKTGLSKTVVSQYQLHAYILYRNNNKLITEAKVCCHISEWILIYYRIISFPLNVITVSISYWIVATIKTINKYINSMLHIKNYYN